MSHRLAAVIRHADTHHLADTIGTVGVHRTLPITIYVDSGYPDSHAWFMAWARSIGAHTVTRTHTGYYQASGNLVGGEQADVQLTAHSADGPLVGDAMPLDEFAQAEVPA